MDVGCEAGRHVWKQSVDLPQSCQEQSIRRQWLKEDTQMTNRHVKRCSALLITREIKVKTTMRCLTQVRMAIIKKNLQTVNAGEDVEKREPSFIAGGNVNG